MSSQGRNFYNIESLANSSHTVKVKVKRNGLCLSLSLGQGKGLDIGRSDGLGPVIHLRSLALAVLVAFEVPPTPASLPTQ